jgi:hypothetical protein
VTLCISGAAATLSSTRSFGECRSTKVSAGSPADQLERQRDFRVAAGAVAAALFEFDEVEAIALFGSLARPLSREVPRFQRYHQLGIEILHECKAVVLAVWLTRTDRLRDLSRAGNRAVTTIPATGIGVASRHFLVRSRPQSLFRSALLFRTMPERKAGLPRRRMRRDPIPVTAREFCPAADALSAAVNLFNRRRGARSNASDFRSEGRTAGSEVEMVAGRLYPRSR